MTRTATDGEALTSPSHALRVDVISNQSSHNVVGLEGTTRAVTAVTDHVRRWCHLGHD